MITYILHYDDYYAVHKLKDGYSFMQSLKDFSRLTQNSLRWQDKTYNIYLNETDKDDFIETTWSAFFEGFDESFVVAFIGSFQIKYVTIVHE